MSPTRPNRPLLAAAVLAALTTGCASIVAPGPDPLRVTSNPSGAEIRIDDRHAGTTPATAQVDRKARVVTVSKEGYEEAIRPVPRTLNPWVFGNVLLGGLIGIIVDASTGNAERAEEALSVDLRPAPTVADRRTP